MKEQLLVFTDLDATLLDHNSYSFAPAKPALGRLHSLNIPVVLNSSKTIPELTRLCQQMGNEHPFIVENGASIVIPAAYFSNPHAEQINFGESHDKILQLLDTLRLQGCKFQNFNSMSIATLCTTTGLNEAEARLARERSGTEPLLWLGDKEQFNHFGNEIENAGLRLIKGGRFHHVTGMFDKGSATKYLIERFQAQAGDTPIRSVGLGDSPNDIPMLDAVDLPLLIRSGRTPDMLKNRPHWKPSQQEGPQGWNQSIMQLLDSEFGAQNG